MKFWRVSHLPLHDRTWEYVCGSFADDQNFWLSILVEKPLACFKKTVNFVLISYTPHSLIWQGASDHTQSDNIWLDCVSVCTCIYFPCVTSDHAWSWDHARLRPRGRPRQCAQALMRFAIYNVAILFWHTLFCHLCGIMIPVKIWLLILFDWQSSKINFSIRSYIFDKSCLVSKDRHLQRTLCPNMLMVKF